MHFLPLCLAPLSAHTDHVYVVKFALNSILVRLGPGDEFEAVATDSKALVVATGPCQPAPDFHDVPEFEDAPDCGTEALVAQADWDRVFGFARQLARRNKVGVTGVAIKIGEGRVTFAVTDGTVSWCHSAEAVQGQFPPYRDIVGAFRREELDGRSAGANRLAVEPTLLARLVETASAFTPDSTEETMEFECHGPARPIVVRAGNPHGARMFGLLMTLIPSEPVHELSALNVPDRIVALERAALDLLADRNALSRRVAELESIIAAQSYTPQPAE